MNDLIPGARVEGEVYFHDKNIYDSDVDPVEIRRRIGMVFQKPNPFSKSIYDNVAWGAKINGFKGKKADMDDLVERALVQAALWDEVKDKLRGVGLLAVGRSAAASLHRQGGRPQPRGPAHGRALLRAGPDRHPPHRRADARPQGDATRSSSSPTTCSRRPGSAIAPPSST